MGWIDRLLAVRPRTWGLVALLLGLVEGCMTLAMFLSTGAFEGKLLSYAVPVSALMVAPTVLFGLLLFRLDARWRKHGEFTSPRQSSVVRSICQNMTEDEKVRFRRLRAAFGVPLGLLAGVIAGGLSYGFGETSSAARTAIMAGAILGFAVLCVVLRRKGKRFLVSTQYAREQGLEMSDLRSLP